MTKRLGFDLLRHKALEFAGEMVTQYEEEARGDSPIEKLLFAALNVRAWLGDTEYAGIHVPSDENAERRILSLDPANQATPAYQRGLIIRPQAMVGSRRVDFLIHAYDWRNRRWRRLIIECDGHDFHERTKEQARRDRSRDRLSTMEGYDFFRFTGSEIWNAPWGCAEQITDWALKGFP